MELTKLLQSLFVQGPLGLLLNLVRLLFVLLFGALALIGGFIEWLCEFLKHRNFKEEEEEEKECNPPAPEPVMRRPDPCIYSQSFLASQGLPVTWNNPDIWMAKAATPTQIEPDSYHLEGDTDYIVSVQCHNASTDLALGVKVRLLYRPWSFNSPDLLPVQVNAAGQEVVRFVNIPGMGSTIATFNWHTPKPPPGETQHFCLQAHLSHSMDINLENNMGQENTNVHSANPGHVKAGELVEVDVPLFNSARRGRQFAFHADAYAIDTDTTIQLELKKNTGREPWPLSKRLGSFIPTFGLPEDEPPPPPPPPDIELTAAAAQPRPPRGTRRPHFDFVRPRRRTVTRARYTGFEAYREKLRTQTFPLPAGMTFETPGTGPALPLPPGGNHTVPVRIKVPDDAQTGAEYSINVRATGEDGRLAGGVTFLLRVEN